VIRESGIPCAPTPFIFGVILVGPYNDHGWSEAHYTAGQLFPLISGSYGFLAILVALLSNFNAVWSIPISFFFAAIAIGSLQLPLQMQLDSSMGGVLEGLFGSRWRL